MYAMLALAALGAILWRDGAAPLLPAMRLSEWTRSAGLGLGLGTLVLLIDLLAISRFTWARSLAARFREILGSMGIGSVVLLALASSVAEEALFRGLLQPWLGLWMTSLLFGLAHFPLDRELLPWTLFAFVVGLALGVLFELTGNLAAPVLAHFLINLLGLWFIVRHRTNDGKS